MAKESYVIEIIQNARFLLKVRRQNSVGIDTTGDLKRMSKNKNKFDLTHMVRDGFVKEGENLYFVSDPKYTCTVKKMPNHECKVVYKGETLTVHAVCVKFLGTEPPDHATRWIRTAAGKTLYELWQQTLVQDEAA